MPLNQAISLNSLSNNAVDLNFQYTVPNSNPFAPEWSTKCEYGAYD